MITRNIVALKSFSISIGLEQISFEKGDEKRVKFKNESNYKALLSFGNFREKHNGEPIVKKEKIEEIKKETVVLESSFVPLSSDSVSNDVYTFTEIGQICENCGTSMKVSGESNFEEAHVYNFICPICKLEKEVRKKSEPVEAEETTEETTEVEEEFKQEINPRVCPICGNKKRINSKYCRNCNNH